MKRYHIAAFGLIIGVALLAPTVLFSQSSCVVIATGTVNKRTGPGTNFSASGSMTPGLPLNVNGYANSTADFRWFWLDDGTWVREDVVTSSGDCNNLPLITDPNPNAIAALNTPGALCVTVDRRQLRQAERPNAQLLVLDRSGSMSDRTRLGERRIDVAEDVLLEYVDELKQGDEVGLRAYGFGESCGMDSTRLVFPVSNVDREDLRGTIRQIAVPDGLTPIALSIQQFPSDLRNVNGSKEVVIVTDGQESCEGDPIAEAARIAAADPDLTIHVVGFDINDALAQANLRGIPQVARGNYVEAVRSDDLLQALSVVYRMPFDVLDANNDVIDSGLANRSTIPLPPDTYTVIMPELDIKETDITVERGRGTRIDVDQRGNYTVLQNDAICIAALCPEVPLPRLTVGGQGRVNTDDPGRSQARLVRVRTEPGLDGAEVGRLEILEAFEVLDGPICNDGFLWWEVENERLSGWSAEGVFGNYFVEPIDGRG
jgi:Mg-chelatase subunit ChlD